MEKRKMSYSIGLVVAIAALFLACSSLLHMPAEAYAALVVDSPQSQGTVNVQTESAKKPAKATISSFKSGSVGKATVRVKAVPGADGYQYRIALNKGMTKSVKTKRSFKRFLTFSGLSKGKKYYVKVRAYKAYHGKKVWGSWSAVKSVTVKSGKQPANGIYTVSLDDGNGMARISGNRLTLDGGVTYFKKLDYLAGDGPKRYIWSSVTFTLDGNTRYGIDNTDRGVLELFSKSEFANMLASGSNRLPFVTVRVESGKVDYVGTLWV